MANLCLALVNQTASVQGITECIGVDGNEKLVQNDKVKGGRDGIVMVAASITVGLCTWCGLKMCTVCRVTICTIGGLRCTQRG